eukprot:375654_1
MRNTLKTYVFLVILVVMYVGLVTLTQLHTFRNDITRSRALNRSIAQYHGNRHLCKVMDSEHIHGQWVKRNFSQSETWPCCGWDNNDFLQYPEECGTQTMEKHHNIYIGNSAFFTHSGGRGCQKNCDPMEGQIISAQWEPNNCTLLLFNPQTFCNILKNRSILVIGDSIMEQTAATLMNSVHYSCPQQIRFAPGDTLIGKRFSGYNRGSTWFHSVDLYDPDILIINAGAHIRKEDDFMNVIRNVSIEFKNRYLKKNKTLIWKSMSHGGIYESSKIKLNYDQLFTRGYASSKNSVFKQFMVP